MGRKARSVMGVRASAPRVTARALWLIVIYLALPLMTLLLGFDLAVWWLADAVWGVCVALWCWF